MFRCCAVFAICVIASLTGCVQSLHPYYTEGQLTYDPSLIGNWTTSEKDENFAITGDPEEKAYRVVYTDEDKKDGKFDVRLAKVDSHLLLDITPEEMERDDQSEMHRAHLLSVHSFLLLKRDEKNPNVLHIRAMDYDWLKEHLEKNPTAVAHEMLAEKRIILTAPTEKLQAFVLKHVDTPDAYADWQEIHRVDDAPDVKPKNSPEKVTEKKDE